MQIRLGHSLLPRRVGKLSEYEKSDVVWEESYQDLLKLLVLKRGSWFEPVTAYRDIVARHRKTRSLPEAQYICRANGLNAVFSILMDARRVLRDLNMEMTLVQFMAFMRQHEEGPDGP